MSRRPVLPAALLVTLAACGSLGALEQRSLHGPSAEEIWTAMVVLTTGRDPSFDEKRQWNDQMDGRISRYLSQNPGLANSIDVQTFQFLRQVTVGMTKDQALILLGSPVLATTDAAQIETLARKFWPAIKPKGVTEAWLYPQGWRLYLSDATIVDITQYLERMP